ncbi:MAG: RNA polymerase sigma factor [bacterium]|nr:RNA polymerase sigma factor [bacterium]
MTPSENKKDRDSKEDVLTNAYHDNEKGLKKYAFFKLHDRDRSEDLVQDTFLKTWRYLIRGGKIDLAKAFLYHILNNLIVDEYRKRKTISLDGLLEKGFAPRANGPESSSDMGDSRTALLLLEQLPERYKKVLHLRYVQGLSLKEISLITGQSKNVIAVQVHRGLAKIRHLYGQVHVQKK